MKRRLVREGAHKKERFPSKNLEIWRKSQVSPRREKESERTARRGTELKKAFLISTYEIRIEADQSVGTDHYRG